jgi:hypothetical protein
MTSKYFNLNEEAIASLRKDLSKINSADECAVDLVMYEFIATLAKSIPEAKDYLVKTYGDETLEATLGETK